MSLSAADVAKLKKLIQLAQALLSGAEGALRSRNATRATKAAKITKQAKPQQRLRRSGKELITFRKMLQAERKRGVPVAELAKQHGVSTVYIYKLG